jgi:protein-L-isoaspartate O-methyltransferase
MLLNRIFLTVVLVAAASAQQVAAPAAEQSAASAPTGEKLAPYYPTPETIVERMLELGQLKAGEKMFDLGSGDGRIVFMAARKYHADATGIELDPDLVTQSSAKLRQLGLQKTARIIHGDILKQNYSSANLITVYLLPESNIKVQPLLEAQLKKGTRVVAHDFGIGTWMPVKTETIPDDGEGRSHTLYLYIR